MLSRQQFKRDLSRLANTTTDVAGNDYDVKSYVRGWRASQQETGRSNTTPLERADARNEPNEWYDGYSDHSQDNPKYHYRDCPGCSGVPGADCPIGVG